MVARNGPDQRTFLERVVHECAHAAKDGSKDTEPQRAITLGRRNQKSLGCDRTHSVVRVVVTETEEDEEVEGVLVVSNERDQCRACRSLGLEPGQFLAQRMAFREHPLRQFAEGVRFAFLGDRKATDLHAMDHLLARR